VRLVHFSDLHLGYRQYQRQTPAGINQREADVAATFKRAIDKTIELAPDVVLIAGDVFHTVRPTNPAILHAFMQFQRLATALPHTSVVMVAGNHDAARSTETGCILRLFAQLGFSVADKGPERIVLPAHDMAVLAVPGNARHPELVPEGDARYNVLLLHGEIDGVVPSYAAPIDRAKPVYTAADLRLEQWSYVALGDYHVYRKVAANAYYSGSLDYTSLNYWGDRQVEIAEHLPGKGIIEFDLDTGRHKFHPVGASRPLIDLPVINARGLAPETVDAEIRTRVDRVKGGIDDKLVRLVVYDLPRHVARELDHRALREYRRRALHFHLDARRPDAIRSSAAGAPGRRPSLADTVRDKLQARTLEAGIDRQALVELGLRYLRDAELVAAPSSADAAADA
jgi:exonuclease SbcD